MKFLYSMLKWNILKLKAICPIALLAMAMYHGNREKVKTEKIWWTLHERKIHGCFADTAKTFHALPDRKSFLTTFSNFKHGYIKKFYWSSHIFHRSSHFYISRGPRTDKFRGVCFDTDVTLIFLYSRTDINTWWPSYAIRQHESGSTLAQVMACCLTAPSHNLNQCWLILSKV